MLIEAVEAVDANATAIMVYDFKLEEFKKDSKRLRAKMYDEDKIHDAIEQPTALSQHWPHDWNMAHNWSYWEYEMQSF